MALRWLQSVFTEANGQAALQNYASSVPRETKLNALLGRASQSVPAGVGLRLTHSPVVNPGIQKVLAGPVSCKKSSQYRVRKALGGV